MAPGWVKELAMAQERELEQETGLGQEKVQEKERAQEERSELDLVRAGAEALSPKHIQILKPDPAVILLI
jgi:hypothetical protein